MGRSYIIVNEPKAKVCARCERSKHQQPIRIHKLGLICT